MRIAHVVATFPPHIGGMGRVAFDECQKLSKRGHEIIVFTLSYPDTIYNDNRCPFTVVRLKPFIKAGDAGFVPQLFGKLKDFDILHLHYPWYGGAEWVWLARHFHKQKYVLTYHMDAAPTTWGKRLVKKIYDKLVTPIILKNAEKIIRLNELPNGVDTEIFKPKPVNFAALGLEAWKDQKILLFVGNLLSVKRLDLLLRAMQQLKEQAKLLVVGGGYKEKKYKQLAQELGLTESVLFVGACNSQKKLVDYYNVATVVVVPSDAESFSLVAIEAMACGKPVVASDVANMRERIEPKINGFLFTPGKVESLTEVLKKNLALSDEERKTMGERGRQKVLAEYALERHIDRLEKIYGL